MLTTALLPQSAPLEPMHAQYVPVLTDIAPLLLIRELPQDEYPTPALPRPFTSHDVEPVMFGVRTSVEQSGRHGFLATGPSKKQAKVIVQRVSSGGATRLTFRHLAQATCMARLQLCSPPPSCRSCASRFNAEKRANGCWLDSRTRSVSR